jgi:hypothetical protein
LDSYYYSVAINLFGFILSFKLNGIFDIETPIL